ncbi:protein phosphatase 1, regulatory subunit, partial [Coemansia furcata]
SAPVVLESVKLTGLALTGCIKVHNLAYEKAVTVRLTRDDWKTAEDVPATYLRSIVGADRRRSGVDRFAFTIHCASIAVPTTISMCVRYQVGGQEHWDNNKGANYSFILTPTAVANATTTVSSTKVRAFTRGFDAPSSRSIKTAGTNASSIPLPAPSVSPADTRRYMRYSEARFAAATPIQPPVRTPSPTMRTGSPLAAAYVWAPYPPPCINHHILRI